MIKMTPELQEAYNEWLLKFGFREVPYLTFTDANMMLDAIEISFKDWKRCIIYNMSGYKLRTLDEIEIYDKNNK